MSDFDEFDAAFAPDLVARLGDDAAVEHMRRGSAAKDKYPAIVGRLRTESVPVAVMGNVERYEDQDLCQVSIECPPGSVSPGDLLAVFKHASGEPATADAERFVIRTITSVTDGLTTVDVYRRALTKMQQRGLEARA